VSELAFFCRNKQD